MARADCHSSNPILTGILTTVDVNAGHFPPPAAPTNASKCYESLAASTRNSSPGDEHASARCVIYEQCCSDRAANSAASDHLSKHVAAATAGIPTERSAAYFSAASGCLPTGAVDELAAAESAADNTVSAAAVFPAANIYWVTTDISNGCTASSAEPADYISADSVAPEPTALRAAAGTATGTSADASCSANSTKPADDPTAIARHSLFRAREARNSGPREHEPCRS